MQINLRDSSTLAGMDEKIRNKMTVEELKDAEQAESKESNKNGITHDELKCEQMATVRNEPGVATTSNKVNELPKNADSQTQPAIEVRITLALTTRPHMAANALR